MVKVKYLIVRKTLRPSSAYEVAQAMSTAASGLVIGRSSGLFSRVADTLVQFLVYSHEVMVEAKIVGPGRRAECARTHGLLKVAASVDAFD